MRFAGILCLMAFVAGAGCDQAAPKPTASHAKSPTVASLVPSASDLLIGMGVKDHLVAVSNYDHDPETAGLPRVGDYETIDWEKLAQLRPNVIVSWYGPGKTPAGFEERAKELNIRELNLQFSRLSDVYDALGALGDTVDEKAAAQEELKKLKGGIAEVETRVKGKPRVRAVIVTDASGLDFAGRGNYLDDLLNAAGGENAVTATGYVTLDREAIAALKPDVILQLMPGADADAVAKNAEFWKAFADLPAVKEHRVCQFTQTYMMVPGSHVADVARMFAAALHPMPASQPATRDALSNGGARGG